MRNRKVIAILAITIVIACGITGYVIYMQTLTAEFKPCTSVFHILFEDKSGVLVGNLTGEFRITKGWHASLIDSILNLAFVSERFDRNHEPYINNVTLEVSFAVMFFEFGPPPPVPPPVPRNQSLLDGEQVVFYHTSTSISRLKHPAVVIFLWFSSFQVHFSDGQKWATNQQLTIFNQYTEVSELSGKTETTTVTLTTLEKVSPPIKKI